MQWESCLACSCLHFGFLVPENVKQLFSLSLSQLAWMPGHSDTYMHHIDLEHICHACTHMMCMPDVTSQGSQIMQTMSS